MWLIYSKRSATLALSVIAFSQKSLPNFPTSPGYPLGGFCRKIVAKCANGDSKAVPTNVRNFLASSQFILWAILVADAVILC